MIIKNIINIICKKFPMFLLEGIRPLTHVDGHARDCSFSWEADTGQPPRGGKRGGPRMMRLVGETRIKDPKGAVFGPLGTNFYSLKYKNGPEK